MQETPSQITADPIEGEIDLNNIPTELDSVFTRDYSELVKRF